ncbi:MAG: RHS repeat-associated core domain-containing protein, partial [Dehalococcoidia bacterium]
TYAYDRLGQLTGVTDAMGNVTTIEYDLAGRKTEMTDPDMGHWSYGYNSAGSLTSQTDARSVETHIEYDNLERPEHKYYVNATDPPVEWLYDVYPTDTGNLACTSPGGFQTAQGMMTGMIDGAGTAFACYDERGRQTDTRRLITGDATAYDISSTYDALGQVDELTYPDGEVVRIDKYNEGQASGLTSTSYGETLASAAWYTPWGAPSQVVLGNGLTTAYGYDSRGRLTSLTTAAVQNLAQTYDEASNVKTVTDATAGETVTYTYDKLNRLTAATGFLGGFTALYAYDKVGNLTRKAEGQLDLTLAYPAAGQPRPHAVTSAKFTGTATDYKTLAYDLNGNLDHVNSAAESDYTFDAENRLSARTYGGATTAYTYDGGGTMLKRSTVGAGGTETTTYIGGIYEKTLRPGGVTETTKYYQFGGRTVAMRTLPPGGGVPEDKEDCANGADDDADNLLDDGCVLYLLADHLGGTTAILDEAGNKVVSRKYWPYGGDRTMVGDQRLTDLWYTGQREEDFDGLGLYNYKARFYSTTLGRFVSADPIGFESEERYAFASYNPLKFIDPNGLDAVVACGNGQQCESGADVGQYQSFITQYWANNGYGFGGFTYDEVFGLLTWVMTNFKWEPSRMLDAFGVAFLDTSANLRSGAVNRSLNKYMDKLDGILAHDYWHDTNGRAVDTLIGFSEGGATIAKALYRNQERFKVYNYYASIRGVVFLDPAFNVPFLGNFFDVPAVDQNDFPGIKFVTVNGVGSRVWGVVANSEYNFTSFECVSAAFSHCSHGEHGSLIMNILQGYCFPVSYPTYDVLIPGAACARGYR